MCTADTQPLQEYQQKSAHNFAKLVCSSLNKRINRQKFLQNKKVRLSCRLFSNALKGTFYRYNMKRLPAKYSDSAITA